MMGYLHPTFAADKPQLVVVVAIDQLRRDRLDASMPGGLGKILSGRQFIEGQLDHGITNTCPGHVVMLTGANPSAAGVPGNSFIDRETFESRYCVDDRDPKTRVIGAPEFRSPRNIRVDALGDWLKQTSPESKVFSVSGKDRAAIAMGGQNPDGVFWYHKDTGRFTSSGFYMQHLPKYVQSFNGDVPEQNGQMATLPERWEHGPSPYRADDFPGEQDEFSNVSGRPIKSGEQIYEQIYVSPYLDKLTIDLAGTLAREEKLGQGMQTDMLIIGLSATDVVGHLYGPRSAESVDALAKLDLWLGQLLAELEQRVGQGNILVALSADHGVAELPEFKTEQETNQCPQQGRLSVTAFVTALYWNIYKEFGFPFNFPTKLVLFGGSSFTINRDAVAEADIDEAELLAWLDDYLTNLEIVKQTWTRQEVLTGTGEVARLLRNSFVADRSGDIFVQLHPDCVLQPGGGTTHGSVYDYDREIPIVFFGWGVTPGLISGPAFSVDIGPTIGHHLSLSIPEGRDGHVLDLRGELLEQVIDAHD
jgi:predicted AlkP superfamily pyrophosphatase or phosphodiesterase